MRQKTNKRLNVALVGAGGIGARWAKALKKEKSILLKMVCDSKLEKAENLAKDSRGCVAVDAWEKCATSGEIDAAIVALPHALLAPVTRAFLKNKKHVLCENPGGITPKEIRRNLALAKKKHLRYMVGFNHR